MTDHPLDDMIRSINGALRALADVAREPLSQGQRNTLAIAIEHGIAIKDILEELKDARTDARAEAKARRKLDEFNNLIHRAFGV